MSIISQGKSNLKYILIILILAALVVGATLACQYWWLPKKEVGISIKMPHLEKLVQIAEEKICSFPQELQTVSLKDTIYKVKDKNCIILSFDRVIYNGQVGKQFNCIDEFTMQFSPNGKRFAYIGNDGIKSHGVCSLVNESVVVVDNQVGKTYNYISGEVSFSPDSKHFAYVAQEGNKYFVVLDNNEGKKYDEILFNIEGQSVPGSPVEELNFSPDSQHIAYIVYQENKAFSVMDGQEGKKYDKVFLMGFSTDSKLIYVAQEGNKEFAIVNNHEGKRYDQVLFVDFSSNSKHFVYIAKEGSKYFAVLDGKENEIYDGDISIHGSILSPDGKHTAYLIKEVKTGKFSVILDGQEGKRYDFISDSLVFSPDSNHLGYFAEEEGKYFIVLDGKDGKKYDTIYNTIKTSDNALSNPLAFSPDSKHFAYIAGEGLQLTDRKSFVVLDNQESKKYSSVEELTFTSNSNLVYIAEEEDYKPFLVLGREESKKHYDRILNLTASSQSQSVVDNARLGNDIYYVTDIVK